MRTDATDPIITVVRAFICIVPLRWLMLRTRKASLSRHAMRVRTTTRAQSRFLRNVKMTRGATSCRAAAPSRDTLADVIGDLQQSIKDGNEDLKPVLDLAISTLTDKNE